MPKVKTTSPNPSRQKGQRSQDLPAYFTRILPQWQQPIWYNADVWRRVVRSQPVAQICRDTLIANLLSLSWKIEPRDSTKRDEYSEDIKYYSELFEDAGNVDYSLLVEWICGDFLDLPFGGAAELGWKNDDPASNKLLWIEPLDGGTLFPYPSNEFPVGQYVPQAGMTSPIYFPYYAINRIYMTPRAEILRHGWGMPPPEKAYLGLELVNRGDRYYANLLLDTPPVGLLDLGDMEQKSAENWLESWRDLLGGVDPFKIPVLYEHEKPASFISFTKSPVELTFNDAVARYTAIIAASYGMSLSDIGVTSGNSSDTLSGSIRQERRTKRTGFAMMKRKMQLFFNRMLPKYLQFSYTDLDDELAVALGRARLANSTAWGMLIDKGIFSPQEARLQTIADGLVSIGVPEKIPLEAQKIFEQNQNPSPERPGMLGKPVAPSSGGHGEVIPKSLATQILNSVAENDPEFADLLSEIDDKWDTFSLQQKDEIQNELQNVIDGIIEGEYK